MKKSLAMCALLVFAGCGVTHAQMTPATEWLGFLINGHCTPDEAYAEADKCMESAPGVPLVFYDDTTRQMLKLDAQPGTVGRPGDSVTVRGTLAGDVIHVTSITPLVSVGLPVGSKAPPISATDQFGRVQTLKTLRGPKGTVVLFFRSADW